MRWMTAFALAARGPEPVQHVAGALRALDARLAWGPRPGSEGGPAFRDAHANAVLAGADGLERREDVRIGVSLVAPRTDYPKHNHPPEELYFVLAPGDWWREDLGWRARPAGSHPAQPAPRLARHAHGRNPAARRLVPLDRGRLTPAAGGPRGGPGHDRPVKSGLEWPQCSAIRSFRF